jgi:hypothetical protein
MAIVISVFAALFSATAAAAQTPAAGAGVCKAGTTIAASVYGHWMGSGGDTANGDDPTVMQYQYVVTNIGKAWDTVTEDTFNAPCSGTYTINVSFLKDAITKTSDCGTTPGTFDDVYVQVWRKPSGSDPVRIGNEYGAWAGETGNAVYRATASYQVTAALLQGDQIFTEVLSDGGVFRCLASANLDIHKIGK